MISLIFAMDRNRLIGKNNELPWHLPADLQYFKRITSGHTVIMGRKTYESIGKPLPNRKNLVITRDHTLKLEGCTICTSVSEVLETVGKEEEAFVIGGAEVYKQFLPVADRMYITFIDESFEGDAYFPSYEEDQWKLIQSEQGIQDERNPYEHRFTVWERV
ncbi:dihydrofolate reductase [Brevibacillus migulae]|uniref:dihydrofolate reductase n=1 Tax=Brevibacillus migulae TaxID=1644114 RepID=UPI00106E5691|nr:dihydrofolate reductase [Brevibacillus migulae]